MSTFKPVAYSNLGSDIISMSNSGMTATVSFYKDINGTNYITDSSGNNIKDYKLANVIYAPATLDTSNNLINGFLTIHFTNNSVLKFVDNVDYGWYNIVSNPFPNVVYGTSNGNTFPIFQTDFSYNDVSSNDVSSNFIPPPITFEIPSFHIPPPLDISMTVPTNPAIPPIFVPPYPTYFDGSMSLPPTSPN
jgi:hypothetical protein